MSDTTPGQGHPLAAHRADPKVEERLGDLLNRPKILEVKGLGKTFHQGSNRIVAIQDVDFAVHRREFITVIGPSGCGKSTLIRMLAGLETPSQGDLLLDGKPVSGPGPDRGMVFQSYSLFPWLSVKRNVMFGLEMSDMARTHAESEAMQWVEMVGLADYANHYPHQLSGGMRQRVAIARALANRPRILLMDEPFGALDAQTRAKMQAHLLEIWRHINLTVLFITHDLDEAVYLADRVIVLGTGPGHLQEIVEVPVPRHRGPEQFTSDAFQDTRQYLDHLIHPPGQEEDEPPLQLLKMTQVGDEA